MPLDSIEIDRILRSRGLLPEESESKSGSPPQAAPPPPPPPESVPLKITIRPLGTVPPVGPEAAGTPGAITPATAPSSETGAIDSTLAAKIASAPTATPSSIAPPTEIGAIVAKSKDVIGSIESSDRYGIVHPPAKNGQVALGRYGILASGLADDSRQYYGRVVGQDEFLKNPAIQDKIFEGRFGALVQKYGVEGAARAWFAGEGGMNNPEASDGHSTVANYSTQFMRRFNGEGGAPEVASMPLRASSSSMSPEQIASVLAQRGITAATPDESITSKMRRMVEDLSPAAVVEKSKSAAADWAQSYMQYQAGVLKGAAGVALAPVQAVSEATGDWYKPVEGRVSAIEDFLDSKTGGKGTWPDLTGRVVGSVVGIVVGARALGPLAGPVASRVIPQIAKTLWGGIGPVMRTTATATAVGAGTTYYTEGSENERRFGLENLLPVRAIDAATFGLLGPIGGVVARGATWIAENLAKTAATARTVASNTASATADAEFKARGPQVQALFNQVLQSTANGMTKNSEGPLQNMIANYARLEGLSSSQYALRNAAGEEFEGFASGVGVGESNGLKQALGEGAQETREAGVRQSSKASTAREQARVELRLPEEEARFRGWQTQQRDYERRAAEWQGVAGNHPYAGAFEDNPKLRELVEQQGQLPARPQPPTPFEPIKVEPEQFSAARSALNDAWKRARGDTAAQTQITQMIRAMDRVAETEAAAHSMAGPEFMRKAAEARDFYKQNIAPLRYGLFKGRTSAQLTARPDVPLSGMSPTEFHELVMKPVRANELKKVQDLAKVLGPSARHDMAAMAASEMLLLSKEGARKFVNSRAAVLTELLGRDEYRQLQGLATIAEHIERYKPYTLPKERGSTAPAQSFVSRLLEGGDSHRIGKWMAFYQMGHAVLGLGNRAQHLKEAALYFFGPSMAHLAYNTVTRLHELPVLRPLVKQAATMEPGSKALDNYLLQIERRIRGISSATLRGGSEALTQQSQ